MGVRLRTALVRTGTAREVRFSAREIEKISLDRGTPSRLGVRGGEFMRHQMAELSLSLSSDDERRWGDACLRSYCDALEDTDALVLAVSQPQGRA